LTDDYDSRRRRDLQARISRLLARAGETHGAETRDLFLRFASIYQNLLDSSADKPSKQQIDEN
jgi:hypothetical protein